MKWKLSRTVLTGGKFEKIYLSGLYCVRVHIVNNDWDLDNLKRCRVLFIIN